MRAPTLLAALAAACGPTAPPGSPATTDPPADRPSDPWRDCHVGLAFGGEPRADLASLTKTCGAVGGLRPITDVLLGQQGEADPAGRYTFHVPKAGNCYRVFAAGESGIADLDVGLRGPDGADLAEDESRGARTVVPAAAPLCLETPGLYLLEVSVVRGSGRYAVQVWGGQVR